MKNAPKLSEEMEKRLEDILSSSVEMGVGPRKEKMIKAFLATALEEQKEKTLSEVEELFNRSFVTTDAYLTDRFLAKLAKMRK